MSLALVGAGVVQLGVPNLERVVFRATLLDVAEEETDVNGGWTQLKLVINILLCALITTPVMDWSTVRL